LNRQFTWRDGERTIRFGRGVAAEAVELLGGAGYTLLTTQRAAAAAPHVAAAAGEVVHVGRGPVDELAGELLGRVGGERLVALGGGRVVDVAKALAAARRAGARREGGGGAVRAMAIPTTLSGAEMTGGHRHARGVDPATPRVRCAVVVSDSELTASLPGPELAASACNALGHAVEAPCTTLANPVATLAALDGARRIAGAFGAAGRDAPDRDELALGALLAGYAIDSAGYGLHHVLAQTLVRAAAIGHGIANAILLPHTLAALEWRFPRQHAALAEALGGEPADVAARIRAGAGATALHELGVERADLPACADAAARRPDLGQTPPAADRAEILMIYESAL
jgi:alcohol dehydrogenase class IV